MYVHICSLSNMFGIENNFICISWLRLMFSLPKLGIFVYVWYLLHTMSVKVVDVILVRVLNCYTIINASCKYYFIACAVRSSTESVLPVFRCPGSSVAGLLLSRSPELRVCSCEQTKLHMNDD